MEFLIDMPIIITSDNIKIVRNVTILKNARIAMLKTVSQSKLIKIGITADSNIESISLFILSKKIKFRRKGQQNASKHTLH